ncbi:hypothetical protein C8R46DRAFT_1353506 [Mycena filopes]|nr:hypothetical protein C8R46DRAFT_1353506 [Mycena filopes]
MKNFGRLVLAAIPLLLLVWIVLPTQHLSQPLESLGWSIPSPCACIDHACLDTSDGIQIIYSYIQHMSAMWDLVDGLGYPGRNTFVPAFRRLNPATYSGWPFSYHDPVAIIFLDRLVAKFLRHGKHTDTMLNMFLVSAVSLFDAMSTRYRTKLKKTSRILMDLEPLQARYKAIPAYNRAHLDIETDRILNSTVAELTYGLGGICTDILNRTEELKLVPDTLELSALGKQVTDGLDGELARVRNVAAHLPWWDTWTLAHWQGYSRTIRYRAYLKFFREEEQTFRDLANAASAFHNNLVGLRDYCIWYTSDDTSRLINADRSGEAAPNVQNIARNIEHLSNRIKEAWSAGDNGSLSDTASAFYNNLVGLRDYCIWYIKDDTSRLINTDRSREATPDVQDIARDIERLSNRIEDAWNARVNNAPGWPPRLVRPIAAPQIP